MIPYGRQTISQDDIEAVVEVLKSDFLTQGPIVPEFEKAVAEKVGATHAVTANSATSALHLACLAIGLQAGDTLWTSPITFVASANCALYCGATVDFVDIDERTYNMCPIALETKLTIASQGGALPKAIVVVHMCGQSCDMRAIWEVAQRFGVLVIEDASHAIGGKYENSYIGGCQYSDVTVFSFHPVKIVTTAEGGIALTNSNAIGNRMRRLRAHGITRDRDEMSGGEGEPWVYEQLDLGFNYRMTDLQAALGISQLKKLDSFVSRRKEIALQYDDALAAWPVITPWQLNDVQSAWHLYVVRVDREKTKASRKSVFNFMRESGIGVNVHYIPVHTQPYFRRLGFGVGDFPIAERYYDEAISLPIYPELSEHDFQRVTDCLKAAIKHGESC